MRLLLRSMIPVSLMLVLGVTFAPTGARGDDLPLDQASAQLKAELAAEPGAAAKWTRLADVQRIMGYSRDARESLARAMDLINALPKAQREDLAGPYYTTKAWLEYDATNWEEALALAKLAVRFSPDRESRLVKALSIAAMPKCRDSLRDAMDYLKPFNEGGAENRHRNRYWIMLVRSHHKSGVFANYGLFDELAFSHVGMASIPHSMWGELMCRRDYGYVFESNGRWTYARQFYDLSVYRSGVAKGGWTRKHERLTPLQSATDERMPFWTNADEGYVTGSLMAYTDYACEQMLSAGNHDDYRRWASHLADGASRCLAVYLSDPWAWLWRALAAQVIGEPARAADDLHQARTDFEKLGTKVPLASYALGHELIVAGQFGAALDPLEQAVAALPDYAVCWADLGTARTMNGDRAGARAAYDRALVLAPDWAAALHNRGVMHLQDGRYEEAVADLSRAAAVAPGDEQIITDLQRAKVAGK